MPEKVSIRDLKGTVARVFDEPQTLRLKLEGGESRPEHQHPGKEVVLYVVEGSLTLSLGDRTYNLEEGDAIRFSGDQDISPKANEDVSALLVFVDSATAG
ncbi:MAG: cupin domain-containing protein [Halobacteria archaeon]|nr:cupin domain-containing protein [Halobacteria archaeon]